MANLTFDFLHNYVTGERRASDPADAYQYDEGRVLEAVVPVAVTSCEIQYWIRGMEKADAYTPTSITQNTDNTYTILGNIPNSYFETNGDLRVYIVVTDGDASITTYEGYIHIKERQMPEDYVDDDPENEAVRVIAEARAAAATATEKAGEAAASAEQAQEILDSIPEDYTELTEEVSNLKEDYTTILDSAYVTDTASGAIASFPDGANDVPVKSLQVNIEPVQAGTGDPSPTNIRPISGHTQAVVTRCGKNLFDKSNTANILNDTYISDATATISAGSQRCVVFIPCKPNRTYTVSRKAVQTNDRFAIGYTTELPAVGVAVANLTLAPNRQTVGNLMSLSVTAGGDAKYVVVWVYWDDTTDALDDLQIEVGSTATAYEPYNGQTVTIPLGQTVYGGTLDVTTGVLTVDRAYYTTTLSTKDNVATGTYDQYIFYSRWTGGYISTEVDADASIRPICNIAPYLYSNTQTSTHFYVTSTGFQVFVPSGTAETTAVEIAYFLKEPFEVTLTAQEVRTLLAQNNVFADCGDTTVEYRADTKLYIQKVLNA